MCCERRCWRVRRGSYAMDGWFAVGVEGMRGKKKGERERETFTISSYVSEFFRHEVREMCFF